MAKHLVLGMGNPLLDFSAVVKPEFLAKYNLKSNDAILYDKEDIFEELKADYQVEFIAGEKSVHFFIDANSRKAVASLET